MEASIYVSPQKHICTESSPRTILHTYIYIYPHEDNVASQCYMTIFCPITLTFHSHWGDKDSACPHPHVHQTPHCEDKQHKTTTASPGTAASSGAQQLTTAFRKYSVPLTVATWRPEQWGFSFPQVDFQVLQLTMSSVWSAALTARGGNTRGIQQDRSFPKQPALTLVNMPQNMTLGWISWRSWADLMLCHL